MSLLARLHPYDGKRFVMRSVTVFGIKFVESRGWYKVDDDVAAYLKTIHQRAEDPDSAMAFDVCTEEEAKAIDAREKTSAFRRAAENAEQARPPMRVHNVARPAAANAARAAVDNARAHEGGDMTTDDLRGRTGDVGPADVAPDLSGDFDDDMSGATKPVKIGADPTGTDAPATAPHRTETLPPKASSGKPKKTPVLE